MEDRRSAYITAKARRADNGGGGGKHSCLPCCTDPSPEGDRIVMCLRRGRGWNGGCKPVHRTFCPVGCGYCTICESHPLYRAYLNATRDSKTSHGRKGYNSTEGVGEGSSGKGGDCKGGSGPSLGHKVRTSPKQLDVPLKGVENVGKLLKVLAQSLDIDPSKPLIGGARHAAKQRLLTLSKMMFGESIVPEPYSSPPPPPPQPPMPFVCDLECGLDGCDEDRVHVAFGASGEQHLNAILTLITEILYVAGGACKENGAFMFHVLVPISEKSTAMEAFFIASEESRASKGVGGGLALPRIVRVHVFDPLLYSPFGGGDSPPVGAGKAHRLTNPSNYARFAAPYVLPRSVEHVLWLDGDIMAAPGQIAEAGVNSSSPLKAIYHDVVRRLLAAPSGELRASLAAVPSRFSCKTREDFTSHYDDRHIESFSYITRFYEKYGRAGNLCFNNGVVIMRLPEWRRQGLTERILAIVAQNARRASPIWPEGQQRAMWLFFRGQYVHMPASLNVEGCGAHLWPTAHDFATSTYYNMSLFAGRHRRMGGDKRANTSDAQRNAELFEALRAAYAVIKAGGGGFLHYTGVRKPWHIKESTTGQNKRPCVHFSRQWMGYLRMGRGLLVGNHARDPALPPPPTYPPERDPPAAKGSATGSRLPSLLEQTQKHGARCDGYPWYSDYLYIRSVTTKDSITQQPKKKDSLRQGTKVRYSHNSETYIGHLDGSDVVISEVNGDNKHPLVGKRANPKKFTSLTKDSQEPLASDESSRYDAKIGGVCFAQSCGFAKSLADTPEDHWNRTVDGMSKGCSLRGARLNQCCPKKLIRSANFCSEEPRGKAVACLLPPRDSDELFAGSYLSALL